MLFYNFESLDDFMENNLISNIQSEAKRMREIIDLYEAKKANLNTLTDLLVNNADNINKRNIESFYSINNSLKSAFSKIEDITNMAILLENSLTTVVSLYDKNMTNNYNEIKAELIEYNKKSDYLNTVIFEFENLITNIFSDFVQVFHYKNKVKKEKYNQTDFDDSALKGLNNIELNRSDNNLLLISETTQKAYLPYKYNDVKEIFSKSKDKYKTMQDVVDEFYTVPLKKFKNSSISRFRESFYLIRNKEKLSVAKALDLGLELMFKYELNPIIITACRNLDELDIYLDCLDKNELFDFHCFDIKFEVAPKITK